MKKLFISTIALAIVMSCSSSNDSLVDENNNNNTPILLTKATEITNNGSTYSTYFKYDGDKITEHYDPIENEKTVFTYSGDNIVKTEDFEGNTVRYVREFTYSNGRVISEKVTSKYSGNLVYTKNFQYLSDNHIKYNELSSSTYNPTTGVHSDLQFSQNDVTLSNGNLATVTQAYNGLTTVSTYSYDTKNNPMKNVRGYLKINLLFSLDGDLGNNNILTENSTDSGSSTTTSGSSATHTYNANNYPSKSVKNYTHSTFGSKTETFMYEYNK